MRGLKLRVGQQRANNKRYRLSVDVGGTFTDFVADDASNGETRIWKVPSTDNPVEAFERGLHSLQIPVAEVDSIVYGTTAATNALIERKGARTALLTTQGFRDVLEIRRGNRKDLYDPQWMPPPPIVRRRDRLEIEERLYWDGSVRVPLNEDQLRDIIETLRVRDIESVAIVFLPFVCER